MNNSEMWRVGAVGVAVWAVISSQACAVDRRELTEEQDRAMGGARDASSESRSGGDQGAMPDGSVGIDSTTGGGGSADAGTPAITSDAADANEAAVALPDGIAPCAPGTKRCGEACVAVSDPTYGCGAATCDALSCPSPGANGTLTCAGGVCVIGSCGACTAPATCGGGGTADKCGCTPINPCANGACGGGLSDKCGGTVSCACSGQAVCGGGGVPGVCAVPTPVLAAQGQPCASAAACANGRCVDGVCCASTSCGTCRKCNLNGLGTCADVLAGTADPACAASVASCTAGGCSGSGGTCRPAALGTLCAKTCANGGEPPGGGQYDGPATTTRVCNGSVAGAAGCVASTTGLQFCADGAICADATSCRSPASCSSPGDCSFGYYCSNGRCAPRIGDGFACASATECISRVCTGTRGDRNPHCATCMTPYDCPHDQPYCNPNNSCSPCNEFIGSECNGPPVAAHGNGSISCSTASCPANATDCDPTTDECHCGAQEACIGGQVCVNSQCKVAPLWPCVTNDCAYGACTNGLCPQAPLNSFCTGLLYPISECAGGAICGGRLVSPPGSPSFGTRACGP